MSKTNVGSTKLPSQAHADSISAQSEINRQRVLTCYKLVQVGILISLVWKWSFFLYADAVYNSIEVVDDFFPSIMRSPATLRVALLGTVGFVLLNLITRSNMMQRTCNAVILMALSILCTHQGSYNDVTFVTAWWCSVWSWWLGNRINKDDPITLLKKAAFLSRLIISLIVLGGAVGKWTQEYWSGSVLFDIYFVDRDYWVFNYLRANSSLEELNWIAMWYSRFVVASETIVGLCLWMLPSRLSATIGIAFLVGIAISSNLLLFSVLASLITLAAVGYFTPCMEPCGTKGSDTELQ